MARRTFLLVDEFRELFLDRHRIGFTIAALQVVDHAFKRMLAHDRATALVDIAERDGLATGAVQHGLLGFFRQLFEWGVDIEFIEIGQVRQHLEVELIAPVPALHGTARERQIWKRDDALRIEKLNVAETVAFRARAHRIVE